MSRLHPREVIVNAAERELRDAVQAIVYAEGPKELTTAEQLQIVTAVLGGWLENLAKWMIRDERHGKGSQKQGGLA